MGDYSSLLLNLRPVEFNYKKDATKAKSFGLIAEEVNEIIPELVFKNEKNEPIGVHYDKLPALLLNEWQKTQKKTHELEITINELLERLKKLEEKK